MSSGVLSIGKPSLLSLPLRCEMSYRDFLQPYVLCQVFQTRNQQQPRHPVVHAKSEEEGR